MTVKIEKPVAECNLLALNGHEEEERLWNRELKDIYTILWLRNGHSIAGVSVY